VRSKSLEVHGWFASRIERSYGGGPKLLAYLYKGVAEP
jgi:hypothetical protein